MFAGATIVGGSVSTTVTACLAPAELPAASVAVCVTTVVPCGKVLPEGGLDVSAATPTLSVAAGSNVTTALHRPGAVLTVWFAGALIVGGSVSTTLTVKLQFAVFPAASVAVAVTVVVPTGKAEPGAWL